MPANITLNQAGKAAGAPGLARIDFITGVPVVATNATAEASYAWTLLHVPYGSMLPVGSVVTTPIFTFVPDVIGAYRVGLSVNNTPLLEDTTALIAAVLGAQNLTQGQTDAVINKVIQSIAVNAPVGQERLVSTHPETGRLDLSLLPAGIGGGGGGGGTPSDAAPAALGATPTPGTATAYSRGDHVHLRPTAAQVGAAPLSPTVIEITDADSPFTLLPIHAGQIIRVDASAGDVEILADASLYDATNERAFFVDLDPVNIVTNTVTITPSVGLQIDDGAGSATSFTFISTGLHTFAIVGATRSVIAGRSSLQDAFEQLATSISVSLSGVDARLDAAEPAIVLAQGTADRALAPVVRPTVTAARSLVPLDLGAVIPVNGASGAIALTINGPTLTAGANAFVCQIPVESVAGGALTFAGAGGTTITYYGKNPGATPYAAGDVLSVFLYSATTADVFCASPA